MNIVNAESYLFAIDFDIEKLNKKAIAEIIEDFKAAMPQTDSFSFKYELDDYTDPENFIELNVRIRFKGLTFNSDEEIPIKAIDNLCDDFKKFIDEYKSVLTASINFVNVHDALNINCVSTPFEAISFCKEY